MKVKFSRISVVATVHTAKGIAEAKTLSPTDADLIELRLDLLHAHRRAVDTFLASKSRALPILITARDAQEGGNALLSAADRSALIKAYCAHAEAVDLELANAGLLRDLRIPKSQLILSSHDFNATPTVAQMIAAWRRAAKIGCACFKIATRTDTPAQLARLILLLSTTKREVPIAAMGMGRLGRVSRLVLPACNSTLTYGYVDRPQVPGQWPVRELKQTLAASLH